MRPEVFPTLRRVVGMAWLAVSAVIRVLRLILATALASVALVGVVFHALAVRTAHPADRALLGCREPRVARQN